MMSPLRLILVVLLGVGATIASAQTVYSDKSDYSPGQTAIIAGTGWFNDAQVTIQIDEMPEYDAGHYYTSSVDAEGNWQVSFPIEERHLGVRFLVRATGQSSGTVSLTEFTDGSLTISPSTSCGPGRVVVITVNTSGLDLTKPISLYKGTSPSGTLLQTFNSGPYTYTINNVQASDAGNYYYRGTRSSNGRLEEGSATLFLNIISSNTIDDDEQGICSGASPATITGSAVTASIGSPNYRWFSSDDGINYTIINGSAAANKDYSPGPLTSTKWFNRRVIISGTDAGNCESFSTAAKVSVNSLPTGTLSGSTTICGTQPVMLSIAVTGNGPWHGTLSDGTSFSGSTTPILIPVSPTTTTTYTIATLSDSNCNATSLSGSAKIEFGSLPNLTLALATTGTICKGSTVDININGNNDAAGATVVYEVFDGVNTKTNSISLNGGGNATITTEAINSDVIIKLKTISLGNCTKGLSASLTVTYERVAPVATAQDVTVILDVDGNGFTTPELVNNGSSDACGIQSLSLSKTTFSCSDIATNPNEVTLTVVDNSGNVSTTIAYVTVVDVTKPIAMAQPVIVQLDADGHGSTTPALVNNGSNDACGIKSMELSKTDFTCADIGDHEVTLTITDNNNNTATTTAIVTVKDEVVPEAIAQNVIVQLDATGVGSTTVALVNNNSSDACGIKSMVLSQTDFTCSDVGENTVTLTVTDNNGNTSTTTAIVTVKDDVAPVAVTKNVTVYLDATGNGSTTAALVNNQSSDACGIKSMVLSQTDFTCSDVGENTITLTVTDNNGNTSTTTAIVTVKDDVAPVAVAKNVTVYLDATGNGSTTSALVNNQSSDACGIKSMVLSQTDFTCSDVGENTVTLTVTDNNGNTSTTTAIVTVKDEVAPVAVAHNVTVYLDANGNGSTTAALVNNNSSDACGIKSMVLSQTDFNCEHVGSNTVTLTVTDNNNNTSTATATVTVIDDRAPVVNTQDVTVYIGIAGTASITPAQINNGSIDNCAIASYSLSKSVFDCNDVGSNSVTLTVTDIHGNASIGTATVTVVNLAPVINSVTPSSVLFTINTPVTLAINFTDTNVVQATINWDDGSTQAISNPDQVMNIPHTYTAAGVYSIRVKVTDVCGLYQEYLFEYLVAYDPNGGFVTGGGWIESPAGASVQYPDAVGKASFGFVSKYQKGANTPTGNTEFQFKAGNLNFSSTSYQWLVVAGYKAQYKGVGTINGVGSYNFLITAIDGAKISSTSPDKFRIKITNGTAVVYDNQMGVSDDSDASTVLAGGSIVIHDAKSGKRDGVEDATVTSQEIPGNVLSVYPNPVGDVIYVKFTSERDSPIGMQLIDLNGRSLKTETYEVNQTGEYEMSVSNLEMNSGFYLLRIAQDKATKTIKVLKK